MDLTVKVVKQKDYTYLVELGGSLDSDTYPQMEEELKELIDDKTKAVVLDMNNLSYISSAGIGCVMWARKELKAVTRLAFLKARF